MELDGDSVTKRQKPTGKVSDNLDDRLRSLDERLGERTRIEEGEKTKKPDSAGYSNAMRLSSEFISAILVGTGIGYLIDWLAGTSPWAMIIFLLLGLLQAFLVYYAVRVK